MKGNMKIFILLAFCALSSRAEFESPARCLQEPLDGTCGDYKERWFYSAASGDCKNFKYSGCGGNENNFETPEECMRVCKGEGEIRSRDSVVKNPPDLLEQHPTSDNTILPHSSKETEKDKEDTAEDEVDNYEVDEYIPEGMKKSMDHADLSTMEELAAQMDVYNLEKKITTNENHQQSTESKENGQISPDSRDDRTSTDVKPAVPSSARLENPSEVVNANEGDSDDDEYDVQDVVPESMKSKMSPDDLGVLEDLTAQMDVYELKKEEVNEHKLIKTSPTGKQPSPRQMASKAESEAVRPYDNNGDGVDEEEDTADEYDVQEVVPESMKQKMSPEDLGVLEDLTAQMDVYELKENEVRDEEAKETASDDEQPKITVSGDQGTSSNQRDREHVSEGEEPEEDDDEYSDPGLIPQEMKYKMNAADLGFLEDLAANVGETTVFQPEIRVGSNKENSGAKSSSEVYKEEDDDEYSDPGLIPEAMKRRMDPADLGVLEDIVAATGETTVMEPAQQSQAPVEDGTFERRELSNPEQEDEEDDDDDYSDPGLIPEEMKQRMDPADLGVLEDIAAAAGETTVMERVQQLQNPKENGQLLGTESGKTLQENNDSDDDEYSDPGLIPEEMKHRMDPADLGYLEDLAAGIGQTSVMEPVQHRETPVEDGALDKKEFNNPEQEDEEDDDDEYSDPGLIPEEMKLMMDPVDLGVLEDIAAAAGETTVMERVQQSPISIESKKNEQRELGIPEPDDGEDDDDEYSDPGLIPDEMKHRMDPADLGVLEDIVAATGETTVMEPMQQSPKSIENRQIQFENDQIQQQEVGKPEEEAEEDDDDEYNDPGLIPEDMKKRLNPKELSFLEDLAANIGQTYIVQPDQTPSESRNGQPLNQQSREESPANEEDDDDFSDPGLIPQYFKERLSPEDLGTLEDLAATIGETTVMELQPNDLVSNGQESDMARETKDEVETADEDDEYSDPGIIPDYIKARLSPGDLGTLEDLTTQAAQTTVMEPVSRPVYELRDAAGQLELPENKNSNRRTLEDKEDGFAEPDYIPEDMNKITHLEDRSPVGDVIAQSPVVYRMGPEETPVEDTENNKEDAGTPSIHEKSVKYSNPHESDRDIFQRFKVHPRCLEPRDLDRCQPAKAKWYWDNKMQACLPYMSGGCGRSRNRFRCKRTCEKICKRPLEPLSEIQEPDNPIIDLTNEADDNRGPHPVTIMMPPPTLRNNIDVRHLPDILKRDEEKKADDTQQRENEADPEKEFRPPVNILAKIRMIRARFVPLMHKLLRPQPRVWLPPKLEAQSPLVNAAPMPRPASVGRQMPQPLPSSAGLLAHLRAMKDREMRQKMKRAFRPPPPSMFRPPSPLPQMTHRYPKPYQGGKKAMYKPIVNKHLQLHPEMYDHRFQTHMSPNNKFQLVQIFVDKKAGPMNQAPFNNGHQVPYHQHQMPYHQQAARKPFPPFYRPPANLPSTPHIFMPRPQPSDHDSLEIEYPDEDLIDRMVTSSSTVAPSAGKNFHHLDYPANDDVEKLTVDGTTFFVYNVGDDVKGQPDYACMLPLEHGKCKSFQLKWYYNQLKEACEMFVYGACGGNANRFDSYEECRATCMLTNSPAKPDELTTDSTTIPGGLDVDQWYNKNNENAVSNAEVPDHEEATTSSELEHNAEEIELEKETIILNKPEVTTEHVSSAESKTREILGLKSTTTEYILVLVVVVIVGIAIVILVIVSLVHICRKWKRADKQDKVLEGIAHQYRDRDWVDYSLGSKPPPGYEPNIAPIHLKPSSLDTHM